MKLTIGKSRGVRSSERARPDHHLHGALGTIVALLIAFLALSIIKLHGG